MYQLHDRRGPHIEPLPMDDDPFSAERGAGGWWIQPSDLSLGPIIGRGQFGEVRISTWNSTTPVATKSLLLPQEGSKETDEAADISERINLFQKEIEAMAQLRHPCCVQFFGWSQRWQGKIMIVMEFFAVGNLEDYVQKNYASTPRSLCLQWCDQMAQALHFLHISGIIHRDVKPPNFLLTTSLRVKLGDFGITTFVTDTDRVEESDEQFRSATRTQRKAWRGRREFVARPVSRYVADARILTLQTESEALAQADTEADTASIPAAKLESCLDHTSNCGTARWMAPEVFSSSKASTKYSTKVDIFSFGMVMYFIWEGSVPTVQGGTSKEAHFQALAAGSRPGFSRCYLPMREIITSCLRPEPDERPSARDLVVLLRGVNVDCGWTCCRKSLEPTNTQIQDAAKVWRTIQARWEKK